MSTNNVEIATANSRQVTEELSKMATRSYDVSMLSFYDGKIYEGNVLDEGVRRENLLVNVGQNMDKKKLLGASGGSEAAARIDPYSDRYKAALATYAKVNKLSKETGQSPEHICRILGAAQATGIPTVQTEYELVRRTVTLEGVAGPEYVMETFNAINGVTVVNTTDLHALGYARSAKLTGQPEIGDEQIPDIAKNVFTSYFKDIYADSFRYELGMREKQQSAFSLDEAVRQDIPGLMAKMKDDKIVAAMNAISDTTPSTNWVAITGEHYTSHAEADVDDGDTTLREYGGTFAAFMPRPVARAYRRNANTGLALNSDSLTLPSSVERPRSFAMTGNGITGYINDGITAASMVLVSKQWGMLLQGPKIQVTYKNPMTPSQMEGNIWFDFNGFKEKVAGAAVQLVGLLS